MRVGRGGVNGMGEDAADGLGQRQRLGAKGFDGGATGSDGVFDGPHEGGSGMGLRVVHHVSSERATVVSVRDAKSASSTPAVRRVMAARDMVIGTISGTDSVHARTRRSSLFISVSLGSGGLRVEGGRLTHMAAIFGG